MFKKCVKIKADAVRWSRFSRKSNAVFLSLKREIVISTLSVATLAFATPLSSVAQTSMKSAELMENERELDEVEVTATRVPMTLGTSARIVSVISRQEIQNCPAQSVNDLLKYSASVDVRQRGPMGVQTDISINGGTHDQIVILINGIYFSSPHTGHLAADFPISIDDIERIEILEGAACRVYGTSAFSGAINIVTTKPTDGVPATAASLKVEAGSYDTYGVGGSFKTKNKTFAHQLSTEWQRSDGGTENSDFNSLRAFYAGTMDNNLVGMNWQLGMSRKDYGANTFYSGKYPNQYEEGRRYCASVSARSKTPVQIDSRLYFNRSLDHYQLIRNTATGENYHMTDVYGLSLNTHFAWTLGTTCVGADLRNEGILSTALGKPLDESKYVDIPGHDGQYTRRDNRTNVCYFLEHDIVLDKWTIAAGLMANMNTGLDYRYRLYPGIDVSYRPTDAVNLYASWNTAQRMPTFTDLYYRSPTNDGNKGLKPEETSEFTFGCRFRMKGLEAGVRCYFRHNTSMIDWIMTAADSVNGYTTYHATNFKLDNWGVNTNVNVLFREFTKTDFFLKKLSVCYNYIYQKRHDDIDVYASSYMLDYLRHKLTIRLDAEVIKNLDVSLSYRWQDRMGEYISYTPYDNGNGVVYTTHKEAYKPYGVLDIKVQWTRNRYELYVDANNIDDCRYYDIGNVRQPGFWLMTGAKYKF